MNIGGNCKKIYNNFMLHFVSIGLKYYVVHIELQTKYNVLTAKSGEECIKKYLDAKHSGRKIDLILLDYRLGDTTGDYVAHKIKELNDVKIIMITAYEVNHDIIREVRR
jgi:CheY-like chemotaxis protein